MMKRRVAAAIICVDFTVKTVDVVGYTSSNAILGPKIGDTFHLKYGHFSRMMINQWIPGYSVNQ